MKQVSKLIAGGVSLCLMAAPLAACGSSVSANVSVKDKTLSMTQAAIYMTDSDITLTKTFLALNGMGTDTSTLGIDIDKMPTQTINGKEYRVIDSSQLGGELDGEIDGELEDVKLSKQDLAAAGMILDSSKFVAYGASASADDSAGITSLGGAGLGDLSGLVGSAGPLLNGQDPASLIDFATLKLSFDKKPVASNAKIDGKDVVLDDLNAELLWVAFNDKPLKAKASSIKPSVKNKAVTKKSYVKFKTPGIIASYKVDGKKVAPGAVLVNDNLKANTVLFNKAGKHKITVKLTNKASKKFTFTYDPDAPTANVKANKKYSKGKSIKVTDKYGLKSVKLNGKKVKISGKKATAKLTKKGSNKLVATDKAGNKTTIKFTVK